MIYKIKATIPISKIFMREVAVSSDMNLFRFNRYFLTELGFSCDQMVIYKAYDAKGALKAQYGLFDLGSGTIDKITFKDVFDAEYARIELVYDLKTKRVIILSLEGEIPENPRLDYPAIIGEKGHNPSQFADKYEDYLYEKPLKPASSASAEDEDADDDDDLDDEDEESDDEDGAEVYDGGLEDDTLE